MKLIVKREVSVKEVMKLANEISRLCCIDRDIDFEYEANPIASIININTNTFGEAGIQSTSNIIDRTKGN